MPTLQACSSTLELQPVKLVRTPVAIALFAAFPLLASAQLTGNIGLSTNYKFRGQDQDSSRAKAVKPAVQGGLDYTFGASGFYLGNWNSSVNWLTNNSIESDMYGGYRFKADAIDLDVGVMAYLYAGNRLGNTAEIYGAASFGPMTVRYAHTVSRDYFAFAGPGLTGRNTGYLNLAFTQAVAPHTTLKALVGFTRFGGDITAPDFMDYSLGGTYDFGAGLALNAAVVGANKKEFFGPINKPRVVLTLTKTL